MENSSGWLLPKRTREPSHWSPFLLKQKNPKSLTIQHFRVFYGNGEIRDCRSSVQKMD